MSKEPFENLPDVLDVSQLAEVLHLSRAEAYNLLNQPDFPTLRIGGKAGDEARPDRMAAAAHQSAVTLWYSR